MKKINYFIIFIIIFFGCENQLTPPIRYDVVRKATPQITSISPTKGLAGVTKVTISGINFSEVKSDNFIYFDKTLATPDSATSTRLIITAPNLSKDSINVKVTVLNADEFSNVVYINLESAIAEYGGLSPIDEPWSIAFDKAGNMYVSLVTSGSGAGVKKITTAGIKSDYATTTGITKFSNMKLADDGSIYASRTVKAIYTIPSGGGTSSIWISFGLLGTIVDLDFDQIGNIWAGGNNLFINSIKPDKTIKQFSLDGNVRTIKVQDGYVYVGGNFQSEEKVLRAKIISADSLLNWEEYFNLTKSSIGGSLVNIFGIGFTENGNLYIGTDAVNPIKLVKKDKSVSELYTGVLAPTFHSILKGPTGYIFGLQGTSSGGTLTNSKKIYKIVSGE